MKRELHWNYKDVFRAARFGFSAKKMWTMFLGILIGTLLYSIFAYLGLLASGLTLQEIWSEFRLIPFPWGIPLTLGGKILFCIGGILFVITYFLFGTAVAKLTIQQLKGDEFYEVKRAIQHAFKSGKASVLAPIVLIIVIALILLGGVILGLLGKIPYLGELILLLAAIPVIFTVFFLVYLIVAFFVSLFLAPAVAGATRSDTFDTLFEIFSTLNDENWRFIGYEALLYGVKTVAFTFFLYFTGRVFAIIYGVLSLPWLMGQKIVHLADAALSYLPNLTFPNEWTFQWVSRILELTRTDLILYPPTTPSLPWPQAILGFLFGILLYLVIFTVLAYWGAMHWAGNTLIFTVLLKKKDDIDLLAEPKETEVTPSPTPAPSSTTPETTKEEGEGGSEGDSGESKEPPEEDQTKQDTGEAKP